MTAAAVAAPPPPLPPPPQSILAHKEADSKEAICITSSPAFWGVGLSVKVFASSSRRKSTVRTKSDRKGNCFVFCKLPFVCHLRTNEKTVNLRRRSDFTPSKSPVMTLKPGVRCASVNMGGFFSSH